MNQIDFFIDNILTETPIKLGDSFTFGYFDNQRVEHSLEKACDFLHLNIPALNVSADSTAVDLGDTSMIDDDILGVNIHELHELGFSDSDSLSMIFTHEMTHRGLQACEDLDSWAEESACDFMSGVMAGMNGVDISKYLNKVEDLPQYEGHPYGFIRSEFIKMGAEFAEGMSERGVTPTLEECLSELNYRYGKLQPLIDEIRLDIESNRDVISRLIEIHNENPDVLVEFDSKMFADPRATTHDIHIVDSSSKIKGFVKNGTYMTPGQAAVLFNEKIYNPSIWDCEARGDTSGAYFMKQAKYDATISDIYRDTGYQLQIMAAGLNPIDLPEEKIPWYHKCARDAIVENLFPYMVDSIKSIPYPKIWEHIKDFCASIHPDVSLFHIKSPETIEIGTSTGYGWGESIFKNQFPHARY